MNEYTYQYLPWRGVSEATFRTYGVKTKINSEGKPVAIGFRYPSGKIKVRLLDRKEFYTEGETNKSGLFGIDVFPAGSHSTITITEGELDACSLYQVTRTPVVSVQSASSAVRDCTVDYDYINSFERIIIAFDNDTAGREALRSVSRLFDYNKIYVVKYTKRKDANEFLMHGEDTDLLNIWHNCKKYMPETILSDLETFKKLITAPTQYGFPYPFPTLTEMTYGIRQGESVLLTAQEGIGKTEIMHTIEHKILKETDDAVGAIFLEEPKRRHLQALAGIELRKPVHLPDCLTSEGEVIQALEKVVKKDDRLHIYSHFGSDDPDILLETIRFLVSARSCRYILLDHISMVVSGLAGDDERKALDYISTRLEMMVKELDFSLIMVSHVNDDGLTRGSRYISKIADIRIDATRNLNSVDAEERNTTTLTVSKNRFSGKTGFAGKILFDLQSYTMREKEHVLPGVHLPGLPVF